MALNRRTGDTSSQSAGGRRTGRLEDSRGTKEEGSFPHPSNCAEAELPDKHFTFSAINRKFHTWKENAWCRDVFPFFVFAMSE